MIICVGREFGSGGHEIAKRLAQNLQIDFWDKELLDQVIEQSSLPAEKLAAVDEKKANPWLHRVWYDQNDKELRGKPANEILFILQSRLILEQAQKAAASLSEDVQTRCCVKMMWNTSACLWQRHLKKGWKENVP